MSAEIEALAREILRMRAAPFPLGKAAAAEAALNSLLTCLLAMEKRLSILEKNSNGEAC